MATQAAYLERGFRTAGDGNGQQRSLAAEQAREHERAARRYVRHIPWDLRLWHWWAGWLIVPTDSDPNFRFFYRWRRFKRWLAASYPRARSFVSVIAGPRVSPYEFDERQRACDSCLYLRVRLPATRSEADAGGIRRYCATCGCPDWRYSELSRKNRYARHRCPKNLHAAHGEWQLEYIRAREAQNDHNGDRDDDNLASAD